MLGNHLASKLRLLVHESPTTSQEILIQNLADFTLNESEDSLLLVKGYAGTGKTTTISAYVKLLLELKIKSILLAPTGRAAKILSSFSLQPAFTIHKKIYRQKSSKDGMGQFILDKNLHTRTVFIVDEASMISNEKQIGSPFGSGCLLNDLMEYVYNGKGCKLLLMGDIAQLPPVGLDLSPALTTETLRKYSNTILSNNLTDVVRQKKNSGILYHATQIRNRIDEGNMGLPLFKNFDFDDVQKVNGTELIETLSDNFSKYGMTETIVVSRSNKRAIKYNQGIRNTVLFREEEIVPGDLLMVVKNNYFWTENLENIDFMANGDIVKVMAVHGKQELYGFRFADCTINIPDYEVDIKVKVLLDTLTDEAPALGSEKNKQLFYTIAEDFQKLKSKRKQYEAVRSNEFFNAVQVKYAYAVTCHKSQGGQWKSVFIDQGYISKDRIDREYLRWLYTAFTRATEKVYLVNFPDYFFQ